MSFDGSTLTGIAEYLAAQGHGTWNPSGGYTSGQTGIYMVDMPSTTDAGLDRAIVLNLYDPSGGNSGGDVAPRLQVRCRGDRNDPLSAIDMASDIRDDLEGLDSVVLGETISGINHLSGSPMGKDATQRHERSDNYEIQARRTSALLTE